MYNLLQYFISARFLYIGATYASTFIAVRLLYTGIRLLPVFYCREIPVYWNTASSTINAIFPQEYSVLVYYFQYFAARFQGILVYFCQYFIAARLQSYATWCTTTVNVWSRGYSDIFSDSSTYIIAVIIRQYFHRCSRCYCCHWLRRASDDLTRSASFSFFFFFPVCSATAVSGCCAIGTAYAAAFSIYFRW